MTRLKSPLKGISNDILEYLYLLQETIYSKLQTLESKAFTVDHWNRSGGGGGRSIVIEDGDIFEKGGVNISAVHGQCKHPHEKDMITQLLHRFSTPITSDNAQFFATGISLVLHPKNPHTPTVHMNYRYFELTNELDRIWWFGGGCDLTPIVLYPNDCTHFHTTLKKACDKLDTTYYPSFKDTCDTYFYLPHRHEHRGIGGIFYDYLHDKSADHYFKLMQECGNAFLPSFMPLVTSHSHRLFTLEEKQYQAMRRGRYVEFNLLYDRGTLFGLKTGGRIESIFMSLPLHCNWHYDESSVVIPQHKELLKVLSKPVSWV